MLEAAPVLPFSFETVEEQLLQYDEMAQTFLNVFSKNLTVAGNRAGRDGSIQVNSLRCRISANNFEYHRQFSFSFE